MNQLNFRQFLCCFAAIVIGFVAATPARAAHDHGHIYPTIDKYLGYDADSDISKVQVSTANATYILTLHGSLKALAGSAGGRARISVSAKGSWTHFAIDGHKTALRIHTTKRL